MATARPVVTEATHLETDPESQTSFSALPDGEHGESTGPRATRRAMSLSSMDEPTATGKPRLKTPPRKKILCYAIIGLAAVVLISAAVLMAVLLPDAGDTPPTSSTTDNPNPPATVSKFLHLSDFHLDILYDPEYAQACFCNDPVVANRTNATYEAEQAAACRLQPSGEMLGTVGCDSPESLVNFTLAQAREVLPNPDFILVTGDYVRHKTDGLFGEGSPYRVQLILQTIDRVTQLVNAYFPTSVTHHAVEPYYELAGSDAATTAATLNSGAGGDLNGIPMLNALGNNDLDGSYTLELTDGQSDSPWLTAVAPYFFSSLQDSQSATFSRGGYYVQEIVPGLHVLSLNTVIYSPNHRPSNVTMADPFGQFAWLEETLAALAGQAAQEAEGNNSLGVYIVGHIPPTYDQYSFVLEWEEHFSVRYFEIVDTYRGIVRGQIYGHVHCNAMRLITLPLSGDVVPLYLSTAFTPIYQNNPGFRVWEFEPAAAGVAAGNLVNFTEYALSLNTSDPLTEAEAKISYSAELQAAKTVAAGLLTEDDVWNKYILQLWGDSVNVEIYKDNWEFRVLSYCSTVAWTNATFYSCYDCYKDGYVPSC